MIKKGKGLKGVLDDIASDPSPNVMKAPERRGQPERIVRHMAAPRRPSRVAKKHIGTYVDEDAHDIIRAIAFNERTSIQALGIEAWNLLLETRGEGAIAAPKY